MQSAEESRDSDKSWLKGEIWASQKKRRSAVTVAGFNDVVVDARFIAHLLFLGCFFPPSAIDSAAFWGQNCCIGGAVFFALIHHKTSWSTGQVLCKKMLLFYMHRGQNMRHIPLLHTNKRMPGFYKSGLNVPTLSLFMCALIFSVHFLLCITLLAKHIQDTFF